MNEPICERAGASGVHDEDWITHAADCADCHEILNVTEWMTAFASHSPEPRNLPTAGFLLVKSRIEQRHAAADRATRPVYIVFVLAAVFFALSVGGLLLANSFFASTMINAIALIASQAGFLLVAAAAAAITYGLSIYALGERKE